jgi:pilus assembly protein FimV
MIPYDPAPLSREPTGETIDADLGTDAARSIEDLLKELSAMHFEEHLATAPGEAGAAPSDHSLATQTDNGTDPAIAAVEELESKLDLARAYADMHDVVQARVILNEVITVGTPEQRREAQTLLARLG